MMQRRAELYARNATIDLHPSIPRATVDELSAVEAALASAFLAGLGVAVEPQLARSMLDLMRSPPTTR